MIADLKPYAEYKESGLPWLGCAASLVWKRSQTNELTGPPYSSGSNAA